MIKTKTVVGILLLLSLFLTGKAQNSNLGKAVIALEEQDYKSAYDYVSMAVDPENPKAKKTITSPRAWILKGEILTEIGRIGIRNITYEPLFEAYDAFSKAIELDTKGRKSYLIIPALKELQKSLSTYGKSSYSQQRYKISSRCFLTYMEIQGLPYLEDFQEEELDTIVTYNAGLAAFEAKEWDLVIDYFGLAERDGCITPVNYFCKAIAYKEKQDQKKYIELLLKGYELYPEYEKISNELIVNYTSNSEYEKALAILNTRLASSASNVKLLLLKANMLERLSRVNEAIEMYQKAIEIEPQNSTPLYNIGVIYFNKGVDYINQSIELPDDATEEYTALIKKGNEQLEMCLPYFEKAYSLNSSENNILKSLSFIYKQLEMTAKYEEAERKLQL